MLKLSNHKDYKLKYYRTDNLLTKQHLINLINGNNIYSKYIPDYAKLNKLSKEFLFTVSAYIIL